MNLRCKNNSQFLNMGGMQQQPLLNIAEVAGLYQLQPATVRKMVRDGALAALRIARDYRVCWESVWACEAGPTPQSVEQEKKYRLRLITKTDVAADMNVSIRTVDRWLQMGLPTRNVGSNVRMNPVDVQDWLGAETELSAPLYTHPACNQ